MNACIHAAQSFFEECYKWPACKCDVDDAPPVANLTLDETRERGLKSDNEVIDPKSTGRKRAAKMFPLDREEPCEWQKKAFTTFNDKLFIGCARGLQSNIHHGPNKDTLHNVEGNVWRICTNCHNLYHAMTDDDYDWDWQVEDFPPLVLRDATNEELIQRIQMKPAKAGPRSVNPND